MGLPIPLSWECAIAGIHRSMFCSRSSWRRSAIFRHPSHLDGESGTYNRQFARRSVIFSILFHRILGVSDFRHIKSRRFNLDFHMTSGCHLIPKEGGDRISDLVIRHVAVLDHPFGAIDDDPPACLAGSSSIGGPRDSEKCVRAIL